MMLLHLHQAYTTNIYKLRIISRDSLCFEVITLYIVLLIKMMVAEIIVI